ncbi:MAG: hypothetical protein WBD22_13145 [Pyrinomonadaceae bacterium]
MAIISECNDPLLRPTKVTAPNGHQTITEYGSGTSESTRWVKMRSQIDAGSWTESLTWYDGLGRMVRTQVADDDGDVFALTCYDNMGRVSKATNPFRGYSGQTCSTTTVLEWTTHTFDTAGRPWKITTPDGAVSETIYGLSTSGGHIGTTNTGLDQAGNKRKVIIDARGRIVRVIEDPDGSALATDYLFDTLGNLRKTTQGEQSRYFMHDSLGRLIFENQSEQETNSALIAADPVTGNTAWTAKYVYDASSNITATTDARNHTISASYDALDRIILRDYSDVAMPDVSFYYDGKYLDASGSSQTAAGAVKGKTTGIASSESKTNYTEFDNMGRLLAHQQITAGQTFGTG